MTWMPLAQGAGRDIDRILELSPEIGAGFVRMYSSLWSAGADPALLELGRLRVGQLLRCDAELSVRQHAARAALGEDKISELRRWPTSASFDDRERACLAYVERIVADPHGLLDAEADAVRAHLGEAAFVAMTVAILYFESFARLCLLFGVETLQEVRVGLMPVTPDSS